MSLVRRRVVRAIAYRVKLASFSVPLCCGQYVLVEPLFCKVCRCPVDLQMGGVDHTRLAGVS